ncbi:hypothetical protein [Neobacillus mesonae]|uniref:hypothetical protein n=1 Tax=Neobacillus mesonae TaxID=1193713 RepID=UPI0025745A17|nr:hypothetical protein [Neobacillus mesonae]
MKKVVSYILMLVVFVSILSFNTNNVQAAAAVTYSTTAKTAMKSSPSSKSKTILNVSKGVKLQSNYRKGTWTQVNYKNKIGWISNSKLKKVNVGKGELKGTITWQYNEYIGTKPDVGASVLIFPQGGFKKVTAQNIIKVMDGKSNGSTYGVYYTTVDGFGNYSLSLPEGKYHVVFISLKTTRNYNKPVSSNTIKIMGTYINNFKGTEFGMEIYNHQIKSITIKKGVTYNFSKDWGYTYF